MVFGWKRKLMGGLPVPTPAEQARLRRDAEEKLGDALDLQRSLAEIAGELEPLNRQNGYARGLERAYGLNRERTA